MDSVHIPGRVRSGADDDNAVTSSDAQAFKRACSCFGLGRYLYRLPQVWVDLDPWGHILEVPKLPAWAAPRQGSDAGNGSGPGQTNGKSAAGKGNGIARATPKSGTKGGNGNSSGVVDQEKAKLARSIHELSRSVGNKLFGYVLQAVAGATSLEQITDPGKLAAVLERLENVQRGVARFKQAVSKTAPGALAEVARALNLEPALDIENIPDTNILRQLVDRLEAGAQRMNSARAGDLQPAGAGGTPNRAAQQSLLPQSAPASTHDEKPPATNGNGKALSALRTELLRLARRLATVSKRGMDDVVQFASEGAFAYSDIGRMTGADIPKLEAAVASLRRTFQNTPGGGA